MKYIPKVGDKVRVKGYRKQAVIIHIYYATRFGDGLVLDRPIGGFRQWDIADVRPWKKAARRKAKP